MQQVFHEIALKTKGQGFYDFTKKTMDWLNNQKIENGILNINILHTSASLVIQENADPDVMRDIEVVLDNIVPWSHNYRHAEGNTAAHVKAAMMGASAQIIVENGRLQLGTWQGIYFCEFDGPRQRTVWVKI